MLYAVLSIELHQIATEQVMSSKMLSAASKNVLFIIALRVSNTVNAHVDIHMAS